MENFVLVATIVAFVAAFLLTGKTQGLFRVGKRNIISSV